MPTASLYNVTNVADLRSWPKKKLIEAITNKPFDRMLDEHNRLMAELHCTLVERATTICEKLPPVGKVMSGELTLRLHDAGFKPFDQGDWDAFAGCESPEPWIYQDDDGVLVIIDPCEDGCNVASHVINDQGDISYTFNVEYSDLKDAIDFAIVMTKQNSSWVIAVV